MRLLFRLAVSSACCALCTVAFAADPTSETEGDDEAAVRLQFMLDSAREYTVTTGEEGETRLELHPKPLLRFNNTVSGVPDGILLMWLDEGRPAAFAQVFQTKDGVWVHEAQSVSARPFRFSLGETTKWEPSKAAPEWKRLEETPPVPESAAARLRQMRLLADRFTGSDDFKIAPGDEAVRDELRRLPTPVYRYSAMDGDVMDGAVFAFVHGTDPELLLVLEARRDGPKTAWHYTLAAMSCWAVQAQLDGQDVWESPERFGTSTATGLYHVWIDQP